MRQPALSTAKQEWPSQMMFMVFSSLIPRHSSSSSVMEKLSMQLTMK